MLRQILISVSIVFFGACSSKPEPAAPESADSRVLETSETRIDAFDIDTRVGDDGETLELVIRAKNGFKLNDEYPHAFRPGDEAGLKFAAARYELWEPGDKEPCAAKPEETCSLKATIPFDRALDGEGVVKGVTSFSVCSADLCLIERVDVAAKLAAREG